MITGLRPVAQHGGVVNMPPSNGIDARADLANSSVFASLWLNRVAYSPMPFPLASYKCLSNKLFAVGPLDDWHWVSTT